jgi:hypothetical protein
LASISCGRRKWLIAPELGDARRPDISRPLPREARAAAIAGKIIENLGGGHTAEKG